MMSSEAPRVTVLPSESQYGMDAVPTPLNLEGSGGVTGSPAEDGKPAAVVILPSESMYGMDSGSPMVGHHADAGEEAKPAPKAGRSKKKTAGETEKKEEEEDVNATAAGEEAKHAPKAGRSKKKTAGETEKKEEEDVTAAGRGSEDDDSLEVDAEIYEQPQPNASTEKDLDFSRASISRKASSDSLLDDAAEGDGYEVPVPNDILKLTQRPAVEPDVYRWARARDPYLALGAPQPEGIHNWMIGRSSTEKLFLSLLTSKKPDTTRLFLVRERVVEGADRCRFALSIVVK